MFRCLVLLAVVAASCGEDKEAQRQAKHFAFYPANGFYMSTHTAPQHQFQQQRRYQGFQQQAYRPVFGQQYQYHGQQTQRQPTTFYSKYQPFYQQQSNKYQTNKYQSNKFQSFQPARYPTYPQSQYMSRPVSQKSTPSAESIQAALNAAGIVIPQGTVIILSGAAPTGQQTTNQGGSVIGKDPSNQQQFSQQTLCQPDFDQGCTNCDNFIPVNGICEPSPQSLKPSAILQQIFALGSSGSSPQQLFGKDPSAPSGGPVTGQVGGSGPVAITLPSPANFPINQGTGPTVVLSPQSLAQQSAVPSLVPDDVLQTLNKPIEKPQNIVEPGTTVGVAGKNPTTGQSEVCTTSAEGQAQCQVTAPACGTSPVSGQDLCISISNLVVGNPLHTQANQVFQEGVTQLNNQLLGREPETSFINRAEGGAAQRAFYWEYRIYYHVDDYDARLWMGHVQIYLGAYEWTLGLYYYIDPNGDLRLVYYSVTPADGFIAEVAVWPGFVPYSWLEQEEDEGKAVFKVQG